MASAKATTNHTKIRKWVEERGGFPAHVKRTSKKNDPGVLRIDYPGYSGKQSLERISWSKWFNSFDRNKLAFLFQEGRSRFSKLVDRDTVKTTSSKSSKKKSAATTSSRKKSTSSKKKSTKKAAASRRTPKTEGAAVRTTNHDVIRRWVEKRGGFPAHVKRTSKKNDPGVLRIDYPGYSGKQSLERISWDEWFDAFEENKLAFLYQRKANSRFSKLINR